MKCATLLSLGLVAITASATLVVERDAAPYKTVIKNITAAVDNLDSAVQAYTSAGSDKQPVLDASDALVRALDAGKSTIASLPNLSAGDAGPLASDLGALSTKSQALTDDIKAKRGVVEAAGECDAVRGKLAEISPSAQALVDEALTKLPKTLQPLAQPYVSTFSSTFNATTDYFSEANCQNGGNGTSTSAGSSTASPTSSQTAASPSGSSGASLLAPAWIMGTVMALFAVCY
ncbi:Cell wall galactomannoprotein [Cordyceps fumosorosea ARSEF 2679]|uniref:Cell wall galactomannoprotein n=1 Tax=Cordyceps fumosorosea (strain ARSEF 2679) TaxID=1081104 RepID=A0A168BWG4_CORFA|nr:Cell wall galactomannoprotein [Cordyceps fumosorosea ARSEF 2679]OAA70636.1 Cell wall galactomannoprotein [Cordyceps fumosorosea ARSEF 2679]